MKLVLPLCLFVSSHHVVAQRSFQSQLYLREVYSCKSRGSFLLATDGRIATVPALTLGKAWLLNILLITVTLRGPVLSYI